MPANLQNQCHIFQIFSCSFIKKFLFFIEMLKKSLNGVPKAVTDSE